VDNEFDLGDKGIWDNGFVLDFVVDIEEGIGHGFQVGLAGVVVGSVGWWVDWFTIDLNHFHRLSKSTNITRKLQQFIVLKIIQNTHSLWESRIKIRPALSRIRHIKVLKILILTSSKQVLETFLVLGALDLQLVDVIHNLGHLGDEGVGVDGVVEEDLVDDCEDHISSIFSISCTKIFIGMHHIILPFNH
jgi:hypothetical protein